MTADAGTAAPQVSLVIEWDNASTAGLERVEHALANIAKQVGRTDHSIEALVAFDPEEATRQAVEATVERSGLPNAVAGGVRYVERPGTHYYELKNESVKETRGEIVLLADSDTLVEPGWLDAILDPFADPAVSVVAGCVFTEVEDTVFSKAIALTWNFPLRPDDGPLREASHFHANNVAFRRRLLLEYPFPKDRRLRGQCATLARALMADGHTIHETPSARSVHPSPHGYGYLAQRALVQGHDRYLTTRIEAGGRRPPLSRSFRVLASDARRSARRIARLRREVDLRPAQLPLAFADALYYHLFSWLGWVVTRVAPGAIPGRFDV